MLAALTQSNVTETSLQRDSTYQLRTIDASALLTAIHSCCVVCDIRIVEQ